MEPNRREFQKQCAFQSFCKRVLHNEACNAHDEIRRRRKREVSFCDLALHEERQLYTAVLFRGHDRRGIRFTASRTAILFFEKESGARERRRSIGQIGYVPFVPSHTAGAP